MSTGREEVDAALNRAVSAIDQAIIDNRLQGESLGDIFVAQKAFLTAQWAMYVAADQDLATHLEQARQPVEDEALRRAVIQGIWAHATSIVKAIGLGTASGLAAVGLILGLIGFGLGAWWQHDRMAAQVAMADQLMVEAHELGNVVLSARSAAIWAELVARNPNVAEEFRDCQPLKQPAGSACLLPVWTMLPPPKTAAPATH
jgi:hypothetical protein